MLSARDKIKDHFETKGYDNLDSRANEYLKAMRLFKEFLDEMHPTLAADWSGEDVSLGSGFRIGHSYFCTTKGEAQAFLPIMRTDITLTNGDRILIIDTKWYSHTMHTNALHDSITFISSNLYQIYAYVKIRTAMLRAMWQKFFFMRKRMKQSCQTMTSPLAETGSA
jgi:hypothetical protein